MKRGSILLRPVKQQSNKNQENIDAEYQKEQQRLAALAARRSQIEQERLQSIYPSPQSKSEQQYAESVLSILRPQ